MKKIIKNKVYDTTTARLIGSWSSDCPKNDYSFYQESLYRKKTGEYFLHGSGGPASPYRTGNSISGWDPGETIEPIDTFESAREWAENNLTPDEYQAEFEVEKESEGPENVFIRVSPTCKAKLKALQADCGESYSTIIERLVDHARQ